MSRWIVFAALLPVALAAAASEVDVRLTDVPAEVRVPLAEGANLVLTARVDGQVRSVWLATGPDARARYLVDRVGEGLYQVNLAEPVLSAMLEASGPGQIRLFAEASDGSVHASVPVSYTIAPTLRGWQRPPRVFVRTADETVEVTGLPQALDAQMAALRAKLQGQGMAIEMPRLSATPWGLGDRGGVGWFEPSKVDRIEVRFDRGAVGLAARAAAGKAQWEFVPADSDAMKHELILTPGVRRAWEEDGKLAVTCSQRGMDDLRVILRRPPGKLDLPEGEAQFTIVQRYTESVPGSDDYLRLRIGDITGGQALLTLRTADGREIVTRRSVRQGESVPFQLGENEYELTVERVVNFLVGDDYMVAVVSPLSRSPEMRSVRQQILSLIDIVRTSDVTFIRNGTRHTPAEAAAHLESKYGNVKDDIRTVDEFIDKVASKSSLSREPYSIELPGGRVVDSAQWFREQYAKLQEEQKQQG